MHPNRCLRIALRVGAPAIALLLAAVSPSLAVLVSEDSDFGADTITHDSETDLRWLDLTLSTGFSYVNLLAELEAGGDFEGYRLATRAEVQELWLNAGIDLSTNDFVEVNYDPIVALTALIGQTGTDGCGTGCSILFTQGWTDNEAPPVAPIRIATLAWIDNTAGVHPSLPQAPVGRASVGGTSSPSSPLRGAWLVQAPEASAAALGSSAALALGVLALSRSARSARRRPRARRR
jgi:hypothetical protein